MALLEADVCSRHPKEHANDSSTRLRSGYISNVFVLQTLTMLKSNTLIHLMDTPTVLIVSRKHTRYQQTEEFVERNVLYAKQQEQFLLCMP